MDVVLVEPVVPARQADVEDLVCGGERALGVVLLSDRCAEDGHDPVAGVGDQRAAVVEHGIGDLLEMVVDHVDHDLRREMLRGAREPAQVGEQHGSLDLLGREPQVGVGPLEHLADHGLGDEAREHAPHLLALERGQDDVDAERAHRRERERRERVDERDDPAVVERELRGNGERHRRDHGGDRRVAEPVAE